LVGKEFQSLSENLVIFFTDFYLPKKVYNALTQFTLRKKKPLKHRLCNF